MTKRGWTEAEIRALGALTDLVTAGSILGMGRTTSHRLARDGEFPVPVLRHGHRYHVPVATLLRVLGLTDTDHPQGTPLIDFHAESSVHRSGRGDPPRPATTPRRQ